MGFKSSTIIILSSCTCLLILLSEVGQVEPSNPDLDNNHHRHAIFVGEYVDDMINEDEDQEIPEDASDSTKAGSDDGHHPGGLPMISDSAFSLVTLIYVSIAFLFVFFMFCWRTGQAGDEDEDGDQGNGKMRCPLMSLDNIIAGSKDPDDAGGSSTIIRQPTIIPATPSTPQASSGKHMLPCVDEEFEDETSSLTGAGVGMSRVSTTAAPAAGVVAKA